MIRKKKKIDTICTSMQIDSLFMKLLHFKNMENYTRIKLFKKPKRNILISGYQLFTIGYLLIYDIEIFILIELSNENDWWNKFEDIRCLINHDVLLDTNNHNTIQQLRFQLANYFSCMTSNSVYIENGQCLINVLCDHFNIFYFCKGNKLPIPYLDNLLLFNKMVKTYTKLTNRFRIDLSFNFILAENQDKLTVYFKKIKDNQFPNYLLPNLFTSTYLKHLKTTNNMKFSFQYGLLNGKTYKYKIYDKNDDEIISEILFYYHNTALYRNLNENKVKSCSIFNKLNIEKYSFILNEYNILLNDKVQMYRKNSSPSEYLYPRIEVI